MLVPSAYAYGAEASWSLARFEDLRSLVEEAPELIHADFRIGLGRVFLALLDSNSTAASQKISHLRNNVVGDLSSSSAALTKTNQAHVLNLHALFEVERIIGAAETGDKSREAILEMLDTRLALLGTKNADKQYLLGIRRAAMFLAPPP